MVDSSMTLTASAANARTCDTRRASGAGKPTFIRRDQSVHVVAHVHLDCGNVLRVRDGHATMVRALSGVLWITEEGSVEDIVLLPGEVHRIENQGMTLVLAHRASRVVLEVAEGDGAPRMLEVAMRDGDPPLGRRVPLARLSQWSPIAAAIAIIRRMPSSALRALSRRATSLGAARGTQQPELRLGVPYY